MALDQESRFRLGKVSISTLTTCLYRRGLRNVWLSDLKPVSPTQPRLVGEAFTLRFVPAREDIGAAEGHPANGGQAPNLHQRAFEECPQGHVLVMDTRDETRACCCGDLLISRLKYRGVAGIVTDGGFRDAVDVAALNFPSYHRKTVPPPSFLRLQAVELNGAIGCAGVAVYPRDVMVGDSEGVIAIPARMAREVAAEAWELTQYDAFATVRIATGHPVVGLYPPTDASRAAFAAWREQQKATAQEEALC